MELLVILLISILSMVAISFSSHRHILSVKLDKVAKFLAFMAIVTFIRSCLFGFLYTHGISDLPVMPEELRGQSWRFALVFWEDVFFGIPIYFIMKSALNKYIKAILIFVLSATFGMGHLYQGEFAVMLTTLYPFLVSYRYGKRVGFGTVMICHMLYDWITYTTVVLMPLIL